MKRRIKNEYTGYIHHNLVVNVFLYITRSIFVIKSGKFIASLMNCICYTFSAIVIKFIAETDIYTAIAVQAATNFTGCYLAMLVCEKLLDKEEQIKLT